LPVRANNLGLNIYCLYAALRQQREPLRKHVMINLEVAAKAMADLQAQIKKPRFCGDPYIRLK